MNTFGRLCPEELTPKQKQYILHAITLIMEKRFGKIKGGACADGRVQISYITKEEAAAPTVSMDALLAQLMIDTFKERAMVIFDAPGAYSNTDMLEDKFVLLKLEDDFVGIIYEVNPEFIMDV